MDIRIGSFVWDLNKEIENVRKHGVDFSEATIAFQDSRREIFIDSRHSKDEERHFCIGKVKGRILTVRFSYQGEIIRIFGAGFWRKWRKYYEKKTTR